MRQSSGTPSSTHMKHQSQVHQSPVTPGSTRCDWCFLCVEDGVPNCPSFFWAFMFSWFLVWVAPGWWSTLPLLDVFTFLRILRLKCVSLVFIYFTNAEFLPTLPVPGSSLRSWAPCEGHASSQRGAWGVAVGYAVPQAKGEARQARVCRENLSLRERSDAKGDPSL